jgi:small subunit ribosomal protein S21
MKILKKKLFDDGKIKEVMNRRYYEKPSDIRKKKKNEAINRQKKLLMKERELHEKGRMRSR